MDMVPALSKEPAEPLRLSLGTPCKWPRGGTPPEPQRDVVGEEHLKLSDGNRWTLGRSLALEREHRTRSGELATSKRALSLLSRS